MTAQIENGLSFQGGGYSGMFSKLGFNLNKFTRKDDN